MTTEVQIQANRADAQKSTGPHTPEGKETAAQNALKHGLFAREGAILREDEREFEEYRENLLNQLIPGTPLEETLAERFVDLSWRLKRAARDQEKAFVALYERHAAGHADLLVGSSHESQSGDWRSQANPDRAPKRDGSRLGTQIGDPGIIGRMVVADFCRKAVLDRMPMPPIQGDGQMRKTKPF
jgi:hypothetical protein